MLDPNNLPDEPPPEWKARNNELARERQRRAELERETANATADAERSANLASAEIPPRVLAACVSCVETPAVVEMRKRKNSGTLVLAGPIGVGKSVAAGLWLTSHPTPWFWISAGSIARGYAYDEAAFRKVTRVSALVIDDLGTEYMDERGRYLCTFEEIMKARHDNLLPTCLTTNIVDKQAFAKRYDARLSSRLCEDGAFVICSGADLRRQAKNERTK